MATIRGEQMKAFSETNDRDFENRLLAHLTTAFPAVAEPIGEKGVREEIVYGLGRARHYGFSTEQDLSRYLDLMFVFGRDFDLDPQFPWARARLRENFPRATLRMDALCRDAQHFLGSLAVGPQA